MPLADTEAAVAGPVRGPTLVPADGLVWPADAMNSLTVGEAMYRLAEELYPLRRSLTGDGFRETIHRIGEFIPLTVTETPTGTPVFDWSVPKEWNIRAAWIANARGERVVDLADSTLHVVQYSTPVRQRMSLAALRPHLHTLPDHPDWIPYRTSYYHETWGFCLAQRTLDALPEGDYDVCIDSTLEHGSLTYAECVLPGDDDREVLLSCHSCHPALANDNLSGMTLGVAVARALLQRVRRRWTYRILFIPGTIGSITWLARNMVGARRVQHGLVLTCAGDRGRITYKRSRRGNAIIDRAVEQVLRHAGAPFDVLDFVPYGYDERQYCSPGFDLPVGSLMRTPNGRYAEYHTSADNLDFITPAHLGDSFARLMDVIQVLEGDRTYVSANPYCEPQLGTRGLYRTTGGTEVPGYEMGLLWVLNQSDGTRSLLAIAERAGLPFGVIRRAADDLLRAGLLREVVADES
jgi:aminopeptidase-like protein